MPAGAQNNPSPGNIGKDENVRGKCRTIWWAAQEGQADTATVIKRTWLQDKPVWRCHGNPVVAACSS